MKLDHILTIFASPHDRQHNVTRRSFLLGSLGMLASESFEYARPAMYSPASRSTFQSFLDTLASERHVREIGEIFLASDAGRHFNHRRCLERLTQQVGKHAVSHRRLELLIRTDFLHSSTVQLEGWILSLTEVELCALCTKKGANLCS